MDLVTIAQRSGIVIFSLRQWSLRAVTTIVSTTFTIQKGYVFSVYDMLQSLDTGFS